MQRLTRINRPTVGRLLPWGLLFAMCLVAVWGATQSRDGSQLVLLGLLYIITINLSLPPSRGGGGVVPLVSVTSLLLLDIVTAVWLLLTSLFLAELLRPLWQPLWKNIPPTRPTVWQRIVHASILLLALLIGYTIFVRFSPDAAQNQPGLPDLSGFVGLVVGYGMAYFMLWLGAWWVWYRSWDTFWWDVAVQVFISGFIGQPFALLGSIIFERGGYLTFILFCIAVAVFSLVGWLSWERHFWLEQQLAQFTTLNEAGSTLRETLQLNEVIAQTYQQVMDLMTTDVVQISLIDENGRWQIATHQGKLIDPPADFPDDNTRWVATHARLLDLNASNLHVARQHAPQPRPPESGGWLGLPLTTAETLTGVMTLQRKAAHSRFRRWEQEMLLAMAGQVSAAIQNARLYQETVRLYNLTDAALARRLEQLQALLNTMQEGVLMLDATGHIVLVNRMAAHLLNAPAEQIHRHALTPAMAEALGYSLPERQTLLANLEQENPAATLETHTFQAELHQSWRTITRLDSPVLTADGRLMGWLMLFRDVTEEQALAERRADVTRMIVHDLRNPLTTLRSTLDLIENILQTPPPATAANRQAANRIPTVNNRETVFSFLQNAHQETTRMLDMVDSLMDVNRMESGQVVVEAEAMRLPPLVSQVIASLQPAARRKAIELGWAIPDSLPAVWADAEMVRRILVNLLDNALKFTPSQGQIWISLQPDPSFEPEFQTGVRCHVHDTGPGIPPEHRELIFDRYIRTSAGGAQVRGTGLGLTFCKLATEAHNGRIWVEDSPEGGSQFIFTLPGIPDFTLLDK